MVIVYKITLEKVNAVMGESPDSLARLDAEGGQGSSLKNPFPGAGAKPPGRNCRAGFRQFPPPARWPGWTHRMANAIFASPERRRRLAPPHTEEGVLYLDLAAPPVATLERFFRPLHVI